MERKSNSRSFYSRCQQPGFTPYRPLFELRRSPTIGVENIPVHQWQGAVAVNRCVHDPKLLQIGCRPIMGEIR